MGLINSLAVWKSERQAKHMSYMEKIGKCPECNGSRITPTVSALLSPPPDCPGCNGSGLFSEWNDNQ